MHCVNKNTCLKCLSCLYFFSYSTEKTEADSEREKSLLDQWVGLTEERNAVLVPQAGSGIPGAPADWLVCALCVCVCVCMCVFMCATCSL